MKALLVIDMINDFLDPKGALFCGEEVRSIIKPIQVKLEEFRLARSPIFYLCDQHAPDDPEFLAFPSHAVAGSWGAEIIPELKPEPGDKIIPKTRFSGFFKTPLEELLRQAGVKTVCLTGVCTSICVMDTAADAFFRDFEVVVFKDCVGDFDKEMHAFALKRMERIYKAKIL
ncbi:cysteine hydrolase family protein [Thermodesulfatator autotrophicus]|uniref:Nicotinamidase n=1 Tax=Thermodesulfatator autotrophicus TaxID=1795632 RepID=A0A177E876_9BACT|nr:isochorismatase family cysteine hydrolase [Thermodesulfatator autotrophicus]OAG28105.1 nicotinamidase [Thermodesulfatator autotrophicus]